MATKSTKNTTKTTKKKTTKKETKKDTVAIEYSPFIKTYLFEKISTNLPRIVEICKKYEGIEPMGLDEWEYFDKLVLEISKIRSESESPTYSNYIRFEPIKRQKYTITQKVREMERKRYILELLSRITEDNKDMNVHYCNLIFLHIAIMLEENGIKKEDKKEIEK